MPTSHRRQCLARETEAVTSDWNAGQRDRGGQRGREGREGREGRRGIGAREGVKERREGNELLGVS